MTTYHYIIAGARSAGCVLANRLAADPGMSVLLIEAGGGNPLFRVPKGSEKLFDSESTCGSYVTTPFGGTPHAERWKRGKVLVGSSSINGMVYNCVRRRDYDDLRATIGAASYG